MNNFSKKILTGVAVLSTAFSSSAENPKDTTAVKSNLKEKVFEVGPSTGKINKKDIFKYVFEGKLTLEEYIESKISFSNTSYQDVIENLAKNAFSMGDEKRQESLVHLITSLENQTKYEHPRYADYSSLISVIKNNYLNQINQYTQNNNHEFAKNLSHEYSTIINRISQGNIDLIEETSLSLGNQKNLEKYHDLVKEKDALLKERASWLDYIKKNEGIPAARSYDTKLLDCEKKYKESTTRIKKIKNKIDKLVPLDTQKRFAALGLMNENIDSALSEINKIDQKQMEVPELTQVENINK